MSTQRHFRWAVLNQSQSPTFQAMLEALADDLGPCALLTGTPFETRSAALEVFSATAYDRGSLRRRARTWLSFTTEAARFAARLPADVFVLAVTNPPTLPVAAAMLDVSRGTRFGALVWDVYPDHLAAAGLVRPDHPTMRSLRRVQGAALRRAQTIITLSDGMARTLRGQAGRDVPVHVIPNWADVERLRPVPRHLNTFAIEHGLTDRLCVMYSGNLGGSHELSTLIEAARILRADERIAFAIVGDGLGRATIEAELRRDPLANVHLLPRQPWSSFKVSLAAGDVAVVTQKPGTEDLSFPSKTYSALAVGSALCAVSTRGSDLAQLATSGDCGFSVLPGDATSLAAELRTLADDRARLQRWQTNARRLAESRFSFDVARRQLASCLAPCIDGDRP